MSFVSSIFSGLTMNATNAAVDLGLNMAVKVANYRKRNGQLVFYSPRGYDSMVVYAAKRTMMQMAFATLNDLYPKYLRQMDRKRAKAAYESNQGKELTKIIENGQIADEKYTGDAGVTLKYKGKPANEALLMWIKSENGSKVTLNVQTYWDKIKGLSNEAAAQSSSNESTTVSVPAKDENSTFLDLGATIQAQSANNVILTKVVGRDWSRKELVSGGDVNFTVTGKIVSNYPDVYPYAEVSRFITLMQHKGVIQVFNLMFQQFNVSQILIKDFQMGQNEGFKNVQPYSFTCVGVEPDKEVAAVTDTIDATNVQVAKMKKKGWEKVLLDKLKSAAANQAAQMLETLTANTI